MPSSAKAKLEGARDQLAGKEMGVGRYYMEKRDYTAAINRFKTVVTQYQTTATSRRRLAAADRGLLAIGIVGERRRRRPCSGTISPTAAGTRTPTSREGRRRRASEKPGLLYFQGSRSWVSASLTRNRPMAAARPRTRASNPLHSASPQSPGATSIETL